MVETFRYGKLTFFFILLMLGIRRQWQAAKSPPSVVIAGCGLWSIKTSNASLSAIQEYNLNLTLLVQPIDRLHKRNTRVLWALQEPVNPDKLKPDFQMVTNEQIDLYNKAAIEVRNIINECTT